jgi:hypothetical protein
MLAKTKFKPKALIAVGVFTFTVITFFTLHKDETVMSQKLVFPPQIEVALSQSGDSFEKKYGSLINANKKNFGLNFLIIDVNQYGKTVTALVKTSEIVTSIQNVMSIMATENRNRAVGITDIYITAEVSRDDFIPHSVAHQYVLDLIKSLRRTGWRYVISETQPRLKGQAALDYFGRDNLDPDFPLSFSQWMALEAPLTWQLYADHTYLTLSVDRDVNYLDPGKPGAYFISLTFTSREETERLEVSERDRDNWRVGWVERNRKYRIERNVAEATLRARGIPIDTHYQDPPLPPPPAGQQNPVIPDDLK